MAGQGFDVNLGARTIAPQGDASPLINSLAPAAVAAPTDANNSDKANGWSTDKANQAQAETPQRQSLIEEGIHFVVDKTPLSNDWRNGIAHYGSEFLQTASLFTGGKVGLAATILTYGLGNASTSDGLVNGLENAGLGAAKGLAMKGMFNVLGSHIALAPAKGIAMGIGSRAIDTILRRETFTDPSDTWTKLKAAALDGNQWKYDAMVWSAGELVMGAGNAATGNVLNRMPIASGMLAGGTFGALSGGGAELERQKAAGEKTDWSKVFEKGALEGGINAAAAATGGYVTMAMEKSSLRITKTDLIKEKINNANLKKVSMLRINAADTIAPLADDAAYSPEKREFVITSGKDDLDAFQAEKTQSATVKVREITGRDEHGLPILGDEKSLFVQGLGKRETILLPGAASADLVATCHPENLSTEELSNHVFPDAKGHVWLLTGDGGQMMLETGKQPLVNVSRLNDFKNAFRLEGGTTTVNVMAPLIIGDPKNPDSDFSRGQWAEFDRQLIEAQKLGVNAVSTDVWWGLIEPSKGTFDWSYYEKIASHIVNAGLDWVPILSFHQCGGNVGDTYSRPLPDWLWDDLAKTNNRPAEDFKFKSEQGHYNSETISFFQDQIAQKYYGNVMENFRDHFGYMKIKMNNGSLVDLAPRVAEINISLGPAGELRYPSYNSHDQNAGYPTRGALQMYGNSGVDSLRNFMVKRYADPSDPTNVDKAVKNIADKWNIPGLTLDRINPPDNAQSFFDQNNQWNTQYGRDLFDWYNQTLIDHGRNTLSTALEKLGKLGSVNPNDRATIAQQKLDPAHPDVSPFADTDIGAKVAGVHWRVGENQNGHIVLSDRLSELSAGLIRTSGGDWNSDEKGHGYRPLLSMLHDLQPVRVDGHANRIVPFFTCIEIPDGDNGPAVKSLAHTLASWFGIEANKQGLDVKGENALNGNLHNNNGWDNIDGLMPMPGGNGIYHGVTLLRMEDVVNDPLARARLAQLVAGVKSVKPAVVPIPSSGNGAATPAKS
jgi:beta-amylase